MDGRCAIQWKDDKPSILWVYDSLEEADKELERQQKAIEVSMEEWKKEAKAAIEKNDLYRGGGVLSLADLMRQHSSIVALRSGMKHYER